MNWDRIEGNWKQLKGKRQGAVGQAERRSSFDVVAGKRDQLAGKVQETLRHRQGRSGAARCSDWEKGLKDIANIK